MRRLFCSLIFLTICFHSSANSGTMDSLLLALKQTNAASYRAVFSSIEEELLLLDSAEAQASLIQIQKIASKLTFPGIASAVYRSRAIVHERNNELKKAIETIEKAIAIAKKDLLQLDLADNLRVLGNIYRNDDKYNLAFKNYIEALKIYERFAAFDKEIYLIYSHLGDIYYKTQHYKLAKDYLIKAFHAGKNSLDSRSLINIMNTVAMIHRDQRELATALYYHKQSLQLAVASSDSLWIGIVNGNIGRIYQLQKQYDLALVHYKLNISLGYKFKEWEDVTINMARTADIYIEKSQFDIAKEFLDSALVISNRENQYNNKLYLYWVLTKYHRLKKDILSAYKYQTLYMEVKDSIERKSHTEEIDQIRSSFELEKKQAEIELLEKRNELISESEQKKTYILLLAFLLLAFAVVITVVLYRSNQLKVKSYNLLRHQQKELFDKSEQIQKQNAEIVELNNSLEKMVIERTKQLEEANENLKKQNQNLEQFSYVISHNLRAPIAQILGLLSVFNKKNIADESEKNILDFLNRAAQNLDVIVNDLNSILLMRNQSSEYKENVSLREIAEFTLESMRSMIEAAQAKIHLDFSKADTLFTNKSYLNSILYNLISNAIKYKEPKRLPEITITSDKIEAYICVMVKDNGLGLDLKVINPEKLFKLYSRMHSHTEGKGMGLFIVKEQIDSLNGKIEVESEPGVGTTFKLYFPA